MRHSADHPTHCQNESNSLHQNVDGKDQNVDGKDQNIHEF